MKEEPTIVTSVRSFCKIALGRGYWDHRPIPQYEAEVLSALIKDEAVFGYHIQFPDKYDPHLEEPILWEYGAWVSNCERWERSKRWAESERSKRNVLEANVKMIIPYIKKFLCMDDDFAKATAFALLLKGKYGVIKTMGVDKLFEKESEIP